MRTFVYVFCRLAYFVQSFIIGLLMYEMMKQVRSDVSARTIRPLYLLAAVISLTISVLGFVSFYIGYLGYNRSEVENGIIIICITSCLLGFLLRYWFPPIKKFLGDSGTRFAKFFFVLLLLHWILDRFPEDYEIFISLGFFSLIGWALWELKLKIFPSKKIQLC